MDYMDVVERAGWTGAEAALAVAIVDLGGVSLWWAAPLALVLAAAKSWVVARKKAAGA
ncbi:hypothetical protein [Streptomyces formicae]|uniref:Uncharacterized protein n=1 Tax=Streptomyces formicae TaxID=1616117 RepID=A0ABY3WKV0_9ACTN|nr:hypothetical protein [Streptomyces formicae]UNM12315.1 hypothetical protein J4032_12920 [Streptomyces formicae]